MRLLRHEPSRMRLLTLALIIQSFVVAAPPALDPQKAGMDPARLAQIAPRMQEFIDRGQLAGVVTLLQRHGALAHFEATGWADVEAKKPMQRDTIFQIMSMTKPFTGVCLMMLVDEGKLRVNDPVEYYLPEFRGQMLAEREDGKLILKKPAHPITVRELMTHTSGMIGDPPVSTGPLMVKLDLMPLDRAVPLYAREPLQFEPGTRWMYSTVGIDVLGRIVEVLSGMKYEEFLARRIFEPLGMVDSHIFLPAAKRARLAAVYTIEDGRMVKAGAEILGGDPFKYRQGAVYSGPGFAMYSTAADLVKFYQMMLNKGVYNGKRMLSASAVEAMSTVQTGQIKAGWDVGTGFGLTWEVTKDPWGTVGGLSYGAFHHGGAFGTFGYIDPKKDLVGVYMIQWNGPNGKMARESFTQIGAAAIVE
ncbi:MAG: serine hydrolase domain-containing protein [Bryobacteraceae bacterium]